MPTFMKRTCSNFTRDSSGLQVGHYCTLLDGPVMTETQLCLSTQQKLGERRSVFPALFSVPKVENEHEHEIEKCIAALAIIAVRPVATRRGRRRRATKKKSEKGAVFITVCLSAATEFENEFSRLLKNIWILLSVRILGLSCSN